MINTAFQKLIDSLADPSQDPNPFQLSEDPVKWTEQTRTIRGTPFSFQGREYLIPIYRETSPEVYIVKGRQTELTEALVNLMVFNAWKHPDSISLFMSSTWDKTYTFSNLRIRDMALKTSPIWQHILPFKHHFTRQSTLQNGSKLYYRSAFNHYEEARTFPVDFLYLDETQSQELEHIDVAIESMSHSKHRRLMGVGTGDYQETEWFKRWHLGQQFRWDTESKSWILQNNDGDPSIHSYHIPQDIVPWITPEEIEQKFQRSQSRNQAIMEITGWWVTGVLKPITAGMMRACMDHTISYTESPDRSLGPLLMGIDFGGGTRAHTIAWIMQCIDKEVPIFRVIHASAIDDKDVETQADRLIRLIDHYEPDLGVMDEGGGTRQMQKIEERYIGTIHRCRYTNDMERPLNLDSLNDSNLVKANRTFSIDGIIDLLNRPHTKNGQDTPRLQIPAEGSDWLIPHFTSITSKIMKSATGQEYIKYDKEPADVHDALMAANYAQIAFRIWKEKDGMTGKMVSGYWGGQI